MAARGPTHQAGSLPVGLALLVAGTLFMEILDGTIVGTAAPAIARSLGVESGQIGVCVTAYLATVAVLIPLSSWLADRLGARRTYLTAIMVFTAGSVLCAVSTDLSTLVAARVLQGAGGALMVPVGRLVVLRSVERREVIRAVAWLTWPALVAPVVAPAAGGLLTQYASWHWVFLVNLPLGLVALVAAWRLMPLGRGERPPPLDLLGFAGCALTLGGVVWIGSLLGDPSSRWRDVAVLVVAVLAVGSSTVAHLRRASTPLLALSLFRLGTFRAAHTGGSLFRAGVNGVPFLLSLLLQDGFGWTPARAGLVVLFVFVGNLAIKPLTTPMMRRLGFRTTLVVAGVGASGTIAACGLLTASTPLVVTASLVMATGVFRSIGLGAYNTLAFAGVGSAMAAANTLATTVQQLAQGLGVAAAVVAVRFSGVFATGSASYRWAFPLLAGLLVPALAQALALPATVGSDLTAVTPARDGRAPA